MPLLDVYDDATALHFGNHAASDAALAIADIDDFTGAQPSYICGMSTFGSVDDDAVRRQRSGVDEEQRRGHLNASRNRENRPWAEASADVTV